MPDVEILGGVYRFRLITRRELRELLDEFKDDPVGFEEAVCRLCVTHTPEDFPGFEECLAGIPTQLCEAIMEASGCSGNTSPLEMEALEWVSTPQARMDILICFCFPKFSLEDLESMPPDVYFRYAAASQLIVSGVYGLDIVAFLSPSDNSPGSNNSHNSNMINVF